jgi:DNA-binding Lrp family transcriptional regulator
MKKSRLDSFDRAIIHYLYHVNGTANTNEIAEQTKMSWQTAQVHLLKLLRFGYIKKVIIGKILFWELNR